MKYHLCPICFRIVSYEDFEAHYKKCSKKEIEDKEAKKGKEKEGENDENN